MKKFVIIFGMSELLARLGSFHKVAGNDRRNFERSTRSLHKILTDIVKSQDIIGKEGLHASMNVKKEAKGFQRRYILWLNKCSN
ncbi:hypothetical protein [Caryophanon tenue]|uniref:Uncharacterized protein n=1 Tax=Caryophanon tenue TaxID=33978 RepID=A0A1C0YBR6_9BACL|nr:hypothetical protein [Caryophanon tenue]OCS84590.1 hypothetical protein A6M13_03150 [Caryophanon tenue]